MENSFDFWSGTEVSEYDKTQRLLVEQKEEVLRNITRVTSYFAKKKKLISPRILDLGCGNGALTLSLKKALPQSRITGIDASKEMLEVFKDRCGTTSAPPLPECRLGDFNSANLWLEEERYDFIVSSMALHYVSDERVEPLFKEIHNRLNPGGLFIACIATGSQSPDIAAMGQEFKLEFAYNNRKTDGYTGSWEEFREAMESRLTTMDIRWRSVASYLEALKKSGFSSCETVWQLWIKTIFIATL